jgi:integrase
MIQVVDGKSKAARRVLPMTPAVYRLLRTRHKAQGFPEDGWIFSNPSKQGHLTSDGLSKQQHKKALEDSTVAPFPPYTLRHTALARLGAASGGDVFALARIAGHSSITITQRYVHPQAETIDRVFAKALALQDGVSKDHKRKASIRGVGTKVGTVEKRGIRQILVGST